MWKYFVSITVLALLWLGYIWWSYESTPKSDLIEQQSDIAAEQKVPQNQDTTVTTTTQQDEAEVAEEPPSTAVALPSSVVDIEQQKATYINSPQKKFSALPTETVFVDSARAWTQSLRGFMSTIEAYLLIRLENPANVNSADITRLEREHRSILSQRKSFAVPSTCADAKPIFAAIEEDLAESMK